jgi:hypothetical protein
LNTLQTTINFAQTYVQYSPLTAGTGFEPSCTIASMTRNLMCNAPFSWLWNRYEDSSVATQVGIQDYTVNLTNFGWLEKASLTDPDGKIWEIKDVYNTNTISKQTIPQQRPSAICVVSYVPNVSIKIRFLGVPDKIYTVNLTYQGASIQFGPFVVNSVVSVSGGDTSYAGIFTPASFPVGGTATIDGFSTSNGVSAITSVANAVGPYTAYTGSFTTAFFPPGTQATISGFTKVPNNGVYQVVSVTPTILIVENASGLAETTSATVTGAVLSPNNGTFTIVSCTSFLLVLANASGVLEIPPTGNATAINTSWFPVPDQYSDVYNNLFLAEAFQAVSEDAAAAYHRQRGVAALLAKAEGLTETQKNAFMQQHLQREAETGAVTLRLQQGNMARGV